MGLSFVGGFAAGMSSSIEKARDRALKADKLVADNNATARSERSKLEASIFKTKIESEKRLAQLQETKRKIMGKDYDGTEETRVDALNEVNGQMFDVYNSANEYAASNGVPPIVDISGMDVGQLGTVTVNGDKYVIPQDLGASIVDSNGQMKLVGNEVHQMVYEPNSQGQPVPKKDANGNFVYEPSGTSLRKYNDVFKQPNAKDVTGAQQLEQLIQLQQKEASGETLTPEEKVRMDTLKKAKTPVTTQKWDKQTSGAEIADYYLNNKEEIVNIPDKDLNKIRLNEKQTGFKGLGEADKKYYVDTESTLNSGKLLMDKLSDIKEEELERGVYDNMASKAKAIISDEAFEGMSEENKKKALLTIGVNTSIGSALAQYVKSISGTAVAEAEYQRLLGVFASSKYSNIQSLKQSIGTFYNDLSNTYGQRIEDNLGEGGSFLMKKLKTHRKRFGAPTNTTDGNENTPKPALDRDGAYQQVKNAKPNWSDAQINRYLKTKGF